MGAGTSWAGAQLSFCKCNPTAKAGTLQFAAFFVSLSGFFGDAFSKNKRFSPLCSRFREIATPLGRTCLCSFDRILFDRVPAAPYNYRVLAALSLQPTAHVKLDPARMDAERSVAAGVVTELP
jgi:hypothetical protein